MLDPFVSEAVSRCLSSLASLLYFSLSDGARVICHVYRALRFSASFCFTSVGHIALVCCSCGYGVACQAACWIAVVRFATASFMSASVFSGISRLSRSSSVSLKQSQSVRLLYKDGLLGLPSVCINMVTRIGV